MKYKKIKLNFNEQIILESPTHKFKVRVTKEGIFMYQSEVLINSTLFDKIIKKGV